MIPKVIHYCWFGRNPLPKSAQKCIASWRKYMPDYEIKEWNEDNFDVNIIPYTRDAYQAKKYAFVSDYARFWILYHYGGVYFDTDVEVIKQIDDIIERGAFMGWETQGGTGVWSVNPGLGLSAPSGHPLYKEILKSYNTLRFYETDGSLCKYTMIPLVTDLLTYHGLIVNGTKQEVAGTTIYPSDYFCPMNNITGELIITENSYSIHWYSMSWMDRKTQWKHKMALTLRRVLGDNLFKQIKQLIAE